MTSTTSSKGNLSTTHVTLEPSKCVTFLIQDVGTTDHLMNFCAKATAMLTGKRLASTSINRNLLDTFKVFRRSMDRGPLNYCRWGIIKRRICVENVPGEVMLGLFK